MRRNLGLWVATAAMLLAAGSARAIPIANGDLVVIIQNNGTEAVVNLGSSAASHTVSLSAASAAVGGLEGAKVVALGVQDPGRQTPDFGFGALPQENIIFSSLGSPSTLTDGAIEAGMNITDTALAGSAWFWTLRSVSATSFSSSSSFSYLNNLGLGTDAVANNFPFSIAAIITGGSLDTTIYNAVRGYADFGGPATDIQSLGTLQVTGGNLVFSAVPVPEPGTVVLLGAGLLGLAAVDRRTRKA